MKRISQYTFALLIVILSQSCKDQNIQENCVKSYSSEIHDICLPQIDSLIECIDQQIIKQALMSTNGEDNNIIGFYIPKSNYQQLDTFLSLNYDNYVQISLHKQFTKSKISFSTYKEFVKVMNDNFFTENWDKVQDKIKQTNLKQGLNKPVVVQKYNYSKHVNSIAMISKIDGFDYNILTIMNMIYINKTVLIVGYYRHYNGKETIEDAEVINKRIVNTIVSAN